MPKQNRFSNFMLSVMGAAAFVGCENKEPVTCILPATNASSNSPVFENGTIQLTTPSAGENASYQWIGPDNFVSNEQNPVIENVGTNNMGVYKLTVSQGICKTPMIDVPVVITDVPVLCDQPNNTLAFENSFTYNLTSVYRSTSGDNFTLLLSGGSISTTLTFGTVTTPISRLYTICPGCSDSELGVDKVRIYTLLGFGSYSAVSGEVLVTFENGNMSVVFCDVPFQSSESPTFIPLVSARATEN